jgi:hypothetical protein
MITEAKRRGVTIAAIAAFFTLTPVQSRGWDLSSPYGMPKQHHVRIIEVSEDDQGVIRKYCTNALVSHGFRVIEFGRFLRLTIDADRTVTIDPDGSKKPGIVFFVAKAHVIDPSFGRETVGVAANRRTGIVYWMDPEIFTDFVNYGDIDLLPKDDLKVR